MGQSQFNTLSFRPRKDAHYSPKRREANENYYNVKRCHRTAMSITQLNRENRPYESSKQLEPESPERNLALACLIDGIYRAIQGDIKDRQWCEAKDHRHRYSFNWLCESLDIDPEIILKRIQAEWTKIDLANLSPYREVFDLPGPGKRSGRKPTKNKPKPYWHFVSTNLERMNPQTLNPGFYPGETKGELNPDLLEVTIKDINSTNVLNP